MHINMVMVYLNKMGPLRELITNGVPNACHMCIMCVPCGALACQSVAMITCNYKIINEN